MNLEQKRGCQDLESLLVKKVTGELLPTEKEFLDSHMVKCVFCVAKEQELAKEWQSFDSLPAPEIPTELYENTRDLILGHLKREKFLFPWAGRIPREGVWSLLAPLAAGTGAAAVSFALVRNLIDLRVHSQHILIALFGLWAALFAGCFLLILGGRVKKSLSLDIVVVSSVSVTLLTLLIFYLASGVDFLRWLAMAAAYGVAAASNYFFGIGNTFVAGWGIYACLASFIVSFIFGVRRGPAFSQNALLGSFLITVLLFPAIYLQGSSHDHGYGIIAFAAFGTYVGSLLGISLGIFIRRRFSFQAA
jgi:hypothetical protein